MVKLLLDKGANIDHSNNYGNTSLVVAAINGQTEVLDLQMTTEV